MRNATNLGKITLATMAAFGLGALAMYVLDPVSGRRRRTLARDKALTAASNAVDMVEQAARGLRKRSKHVAQEAGGAISNVLQWTGPERRVPPRGKLNQRAGTEPE